MSENSNAHKRISTVMRMHERFQYDANVSASRPSTVRAEERLSSSA